MGQRAEDERGRRGHRRGHLTLASKARRAAGETTAPINSFFALLQDDPSIQIVNDAQTAYIRPCKAPNTKGFIVATNNSRPSSSVRANPDGERIIVKAPDENRQRSSIYILDNGTINPTADGYAEYRVVLGGETAAPAPAPAPAAEQKYIVKPGDNLSKTAKMYGSTWQALAKHNKLKNPNLMYPNQVIVIPAK